MSYYSFFNLAEDPFIKNYMIGKQSFQSRDHDNAITQMNRSVERNGFCVITGNSGGGKSHIVGRFLDSLDSIRHTKISIQPGCIPPTDFYKEILMSLRLDPSGRLQTVRRSVKSHFLDYYRRGKPVVLVVNEAQELQMKVFRELRNLLSYENDNLDVLALILVGEPALATIIDEGEGLGSLKGRVTNHYTFYDLKDSEVRAYVSHKLSLAGGTDLIVDESAMALLCESSRGMPREIDQLMSDALAFAAQNGRPNINSEIMQFVIDNRSLVKHTKGDPENAHLPL